MSVTQLAAGMCGRANGVSCRHLPFPMGAVPRASGASIRIAYQEQTHMVLEKDGGRRFRR